MTQRLGSAGGRPLLVVHVISVQSASVIPADGL
jgi:hypothetical protein